MSEPIIKNAVKRAFDVTAGLLGCVLFAPVAAYTAYTVRRELGSPVLFSQTRFGKNGRPFTIYKFRTMHDGFNSLAERTPPKMEWIRARAFDEYPQFWNVVKGDMSIVGPRPHVAIGEYGMTLDHPRFKVNPGMVGLAALRGRNNLTPDEHSAADREYAENWSVTGDMKIIADCVKKWRSGKFDYYPVKR